MNAKTYTKKPTEKQRVQVMSREMEVEKRTGINIADTKQAIKNIVGGMKMTSAVMEIGAETNIEAKKNLTTKREKKEAIEEMETKDTAGGMRKTDAALEKTAEMYTEISLLKVK